MTGSAAASWLEPSLLYESFFIDVQAPGTKVKEAVLVLSDVHPQTRLRLAEFTKLYIEDILIGLFTLNNDGTIVFLPNVDTPNVSRALRHTGIVGYLFDSSEYSGDEQHKSFDSAFRGITLLSVDDSLKLSCATVLFDYPDASIKSSCYESFLDKSSIKVSQKRRAVDMTKDHLHRSVQEAAVASFLKKLWISLFCAPDTANAISNVHVENVLDLLQLSSSFDLPFLQFLSSKLKLAKSMKKMFELLFQLMEKFSIRFYSVDEDKFGLFPVKTQGTTDEEIDSCPVDILVLASSCFGLRVKVDKAADLFSIALVRSDVRQLGKFELVLSPEELNFIDFFVSTTLLL